MFKWAKWLNGKDTEKEIVSPNGRNKCTVALKSKQIFYKVDRDNKPIVGLSRLGFDICGEKMLGNNLRVIRIVTKNIDETVEMLWGEDRLIKNKCQAGSAKT